MDLKYRILISAVLVLTSCGFVDSNKPSLPIDKRNISFHSNYVYTDSSMVANFECEDFVSDALDNYTIANIGKEYGNLLKCTKELIINKHETSVVDTIYTFSNSRNKIQIYQAKQDEYIFTFDVRDSTFKLPGNIKPGITKDYFAQQLQITATIRDKVQIFNAEGNMRFMFYFENNRLKRINSYLYLD